MKNLKLKSGVLGLSGIIIFCAFLLLFFSKPLSSITKTVSADKLDCLGSLQFEKAVFTSPLVSGVYSDEVLAEESPGLTVTDKLFSDELHGIRIENPVYKFFDGAFEVKNTKTYALLDTAQRENPDETNSADFSLYHTRYAFCVYDKNGKNSGEVIYCCYDTLGNADVYLAYFSQSNSENQKENTYADYLFKLSKNPAESKKASELSIDGKYTVSQTVYTCPLQKEEAEKNYENRELILTDKLFSFDGISIKNPVFRQKENAFEKQGKKDVAIMYYVSDKWDSFNSVTLNGYKEKAAFCVLDESGQDSGFVIYILKSESGKEEIYAAHFLAANKIPPYSQYFLKLEKE
ncbi:MAG: hypothetical protein ACI4W6_08710 [Acutalibacteraceae bacterium]